MSKWRNEIEAAMDAVVHNIPPVQTTLVSEEPLKLIINVLNDRLKNINIVLIKYKQILQPYIFMELFIISSFLYLTFTDQYKCMGFKYPLDSFCQCFIIDSIKPTVCWPIF